MYLNIEACDDLIGFEKRESASNSEKQAALLQATLRKVCIQEVQKKQWTGVRRTPTCADADAKNEKNCTERCELKLKKAYGAS